MSAGSFEDDARTLCEAFQATVARAPDAVALRSADTPATLTWREYAERVRGIAAGLAALGVRRGDTVGLMLTNRIEFYPCDAAALHLGATPFSVYNTSTAEQIEYVFGNAGNAVVITERQFLERIEAARQAGAQLRHVVCVDGDGDVGAEAKHEGDGDGDGEVVMTLEQLEAHGAANAGFDFEASWRAVTGDDLVTLIYTSGTTGPPKGVELTHANVLAECRAVAQVLPMRAGATMTSYLPSAHAADRWMSHYNGLVYGLQITAVADLRSIAQVLTELRPTVWGGVPRVFEKLVAALRGAIDADLERRDAINHALAVAGRRIGLIEAGRSVPVELEREHAALDATILSRLRERIGLERAEWVICGAAPLSRDVHEYLLALGLPMTEVYGMSECSCIVTVSPTTEARVGSVGRAIPGVQLRLADDGELLIRGKIVMQGYRADPARTAEVLDDDGWLHSGDVAEIDDAGYVRIVDRKKELIINAAGKNMSPANIEEKLTSADALVGQAICIGDGRPYNVALLVLDPDAAGACAHELGIADGARAHLITHEAVRRRLERSVQDANARLSRVEQIKRYAVLSEEWLPGGDELTPTMKLKRKPIAAKYAATIEELYGSRS
jgi:long-chain acyl-CoA synthetase